MKKPSSRSPRLQPVALALLTLFAGPALAQENDNAQGAENAKERALSAVVVSEQAYSDTTATVSAEAIASRAARDARETLQNETGVTVGGGGSAMAQKIYVREIEDTLLTVTLDGVPQGGNIFHHQGRILIDPLLLKRIEIDKGGTVASVGPGGLAGSVRMTTKAAADLLRPGQRIGGLLFGGVASNDGWNAGGAAYGRSEALDFLVYAKRNESRDYQDGNGRTQEKTAATQDSRLARLNWQLAPGHALSFGYQALTDEAVRYPRPHMVGFTGSNAPMPQQLDQETLTAGYHFAGSDGLPAADLMLFSETVENVRANNGSGAVFGKPVGYVFGERLESSGVNLLLKSKLGAGTLRYGLNHHRRESSAINPNKSGGAGGTSREETDVTGLFAEGSVPLGSLLLLGVGARYDWYSYTDNHRQDFDSSGLSPNASLTLQASEALSFRLGASSTVRGAGLKEAFMLDNGPGPLIYRNAADLREETARNLELGVNYEQGPWSFKGSLFDMTIDDYINLVYRAGPPATATRENIGKVKSRGYELGGRWNNGTASLGLSVSDARPKLNGQDLGDGDFSLGTSVGRTWLLSAGYALPAWNVDLGWNLRRVEDIDYRPGGATADVHKDGYTVHDLHASWQPLGKDRLRVTLSVRNLFDRFYHDQATYGYSAGNGMVLGYADPGRDVRLDLNWKF